MKVNFLLRRFFNSLFMLLLFASFIHAEDFTGQFVMELAPDKENLDQVVFHPARDLVSRYKLAGTVEPGANVTFAFLYNVETEKPEVPSFFIEPKQGAPYLWADSNLDRVFDENEKFTFKRSEEDNPYLWDTIVTQPLKSGVFKTFPLFVRFFKDVRTDQMSQADRLMQQSSEVFAKGFVDIRGKKTLVAYSYDPREKKISLKNGKLGIDGDGNGEIDWDRFSPEAAEHSQETVIFRVGDNYVSNKKADLEKNLIVLKSHAASDYKRLDLKVGDVMPDFEFKDFGGRKRRLSEFRGKYVLMDFWAIWCGPCRSEMPYLKAAYQRYNARGFEILGMNADEADYIGQVKDWLNKNNLSWTQATRESIQPVMRSLRIIYYPTTLLLDPEGKVLSLNLTKRGQLDLRGEDLLESLEKVFAGLVTAAEATRPASSPKTIRTAPTNSTDTASATETPAAPVSEKRPTLNRNPAGKSSTTFGNVMLPAVPAGFAWKMVEENKIYCVVPDGWHYKQETKDNVTTFSVSETAPDQDGEFDVGLSVKVTRNVQGNLTELAKDTLEKLSDFAKVLNQAENQLGDFEQQIRVVQSGKRIIYHRLLINRQTNSLIIASFECPADRWNEVFQRKGQTVTNMLIFTSEL